MTLSGRTLTLAALTSASLILAGCSSDGQDTDTATSAAAGSSATAAAEGHDHEYGDGSGTEVDSPQPRLVATYDGGLLTLDAITLEVLEDTDLAGFNRVNTAGDGRHAFVSTGNTFRLFDSGAWTEPHGDHTHSFTGAPGLSDLSFTGDKPGHVVVNGGKTVLFSDGDGKIQIFETTDLLKGENPTPEIIEAEEAHHGVAVALGNGELVHSVGDSEERTGAVALDSSRTEIARTDECTGIHGEAGARGDALAFGCADGAIIYKDGAFTKVSSPDAEGALGTLAGHADSPVVLSSYSLGEGDPTSVALVNTETAEITVVDLGTSYTFRSLARGPEGEALVLGTDGSLHVIDPDTGSVSSYDAVDAWTAPEAWQDPRPTLFVLNDRAYVTDPANTRVSAIDLSNGNVLATGELPHEINELTGVTG